MTGKLCEKAIQTIARTAVAVMLLGSDSQDDVIRRCAYTAQAIQETYGLDEDVMTAYRGYIHAFEKGDAPPADLWDRMTLQAAEQAKKVIYALCDNLEDPREIMKHIRTADALIFVWQPRRPMVDRQTGDDYWEAFIRSLPEEYRKEGW